MLSALDEGLGNLTATLQATGLYVEKRREEGRSLQYVYAVLCAVLCVLCVLQTRPNTGVSSPHSSGTTTRCWCCPMTTGYEYHHIIPFIHHLYTFIAVYTPIYTALYMYIHHICTQHTSKHPIYTLNTPLHTLLHTPLHGRYYPHRKEL